MITQYRFSLTPDRDCRGRPEWAYPLYAALLEQGPAGFGEWVHRDSISPVSQFVLPGKTPEWHVTLLGEQAERMLGPVLDRALPLQLHRERVCLTPTLMETRRVPDPDALFAQAAAAGPFQELQFVTPTAFKSRGAYQILPSVRLILQSTVKKWNGCFPDCPIEDEDGQGLEALAAGLLCRRLNLRDGIYQMKGRTLPGFTGSLLLENRLEGFHQQLASALLLFAGFAGVGIKTTLGMGGVLCCGEKTERGF